LDCNQLLQGDPFAGVNQLTLLVVGKDLGKDTNVPRTDTLLLAFLNLRTNRCALVSIPRDLRVEIPGYGYNKVNSAYVFGGLDLTRRTLQRLLGITIDYGIEVSLDGFKQLVDAAGGVTLDVEKRMHYTDHWGGLYIDLYPGRQHLDGEQAMQYVRFRHDAEGDIGRMRRQQKFLKALLARLESPTNAYRLPLLAKAAYSMLDTDLSLNQMLALALRAKQFAANGLLTATLPGTPEYIGGISYVLPDDYEVRHFLDTLLARLDDSSAGNLVQVLNGAGKPHLAASVTKALSLYDLQLARPGNAPGGFVYDETLVLYKPAAKATAEHVQSLLGCGRLKPADSVPGATPGASVVVVAGKDLAAKL